MAPQALRLEHCPPGAFVGSAQPRISWRHADPAAVPARSEIELVLDGRSEIQVIESTNPVLVEWPFAPLASRARGSLRVRSERDGKWCPWSTPLEFETTLLGHRDWEAQLIEATEIGKLGEAAPVFGTDFEVDDVVSARLYISAHGIFSAAINGLAVGDEFLAPGWTAYASRLRFASYDVTDLVRAQSLNTVEITIGNGWFRGRLGWSGARAHYGDSLGLIAQVEVIAADGTRCTFASGPGWTVRDSAIVTDDIYDGVEIDLRRGNTRRGPVRIGEDVRHVLLPSETAPVRQLARLAPVELRTSLEGTVLVDFGQNFTGWVSLRVRGHRGQRIDVRHAEILIDGRLGTETLRSAKAHDSYVLDGPEARTLEPVFTFHGFRFAEITGANLEQIDDITGVVVGSDIDRIGWFHCSDERLNRLHENIVRSARSNLVDVPIDCPQRDERLGWTGDVQLFAPAASFLFDVNAMLDGWLADLREEQHPDGSVPSIVPDVLRGLISPGTSRAAGFSDAAVLVPLAAYRAYGDTRLVRRQWNSARRWVRRAVEAAGEDGIWEGGFQWGDWLDPSAPAHDPSRASTPSDLVATAALLRLLASAIELADVVAPEETEALCAEHSRIAAAFVDRFVTPDGLVLGDSVSAYTFAIRAGVLDARQQRRAASRITALLRERGFRASTGFLGTAQVLDALDDVGASDIAVRVLLADRMPSWLAQVRLGATTIWERWNSLDDDGSVNDASMTSFNHFALGSVADWMHRRLGGLAPDAPGYRTVRIAPILTSPVSSASAAHDSAFGRVAVDWERHGDIVVIEIVLPPGVDAVVDVPGVPVHLDSGRHRFEVRLAATEPRLTGDDLVGAVLDDGIRGPNLVGLLVRLGIVEDEDDAYVRLAPYASLTVRELAPEIAHPAFKAAGPFVRRIFEDTLEKGGRPDVRTY